MKWLRKEADIKNLNTMIEFVLSNIRNEIELTKKKSMEIRLICEEVLLNIISYSYPEGKGEIMAGCEFCDNDCCLILKICDYGREFNPIDAEDPDMTSDIMDRDIGGLGILILKQVSDYVNYERREDMNILTVKKYCA